MSTAPEAGSGPPSVSTIVRKLEAAPSRPLAPVSPPACTRGPARCSRTVSAGVLPLVLPPTGSCAPKSPHRIVAAAVESVEAAERAASDACSRTFSNVAASSLDRAPGFEEPRSACSTVASSVSREATSFARFTESSPPVKAFTPTGSAPPESKHAHMTASESALPSVSSPVAYHFLPSDLSASAGRASAITASPDPSRPLEGNSTAFVQETAYGEENIFNMHGAPARVGDGDCCNDSPRHSLPASASTIDVTEQSAMVRVPFAEKLEDPVLQVGLCDPCPSLAVAALSGSTGEQDVGYRYSTIAGAEESSGYDSYLPASSDVSLSLEPDAREFVAPEVRGSSSRQSLADSIHVSTTSASYQTTPTERTCTGSLSESSNLDHADAGKPHDTALVSLIPSPLETSTSPAAAQAFSHTVVTPVEPNAASCRISCGSSTNARQSLRRWSTPVSTPRRVARPDGATSPHGMGADTRSFPVPKQSKPEMPRRAVSNMSTRPLKDPAKSAVPRRISGVTVPRPFHFAGEKFHIAGQKEIERQRLEAERANRKPRKFRARPMPDFSLDPRAPTR